MNQNHKKRPVYKIVIAATILLSCSTPNNTEAKEDMHSCGSEASPVCANRAKVRLYYRKVGAEHPDQGSMFFFDEEGRGFFNECLGGLTEKDIRRIWKTAGQPPKSIQLWGEYAYDRVENTRKLYYIDLKFNHKYLSSYRISGPHISSPGWKMIEKTEENSH